MNTQDERFRILEMIGQGQITAEQGAQLLEALGSGSPTPAAPTPPPAPSPAPAPEEVKAALNTASQKGRRLRVVVSSKNGKERVNVNLPIRLMEVGLKIGSRFVDELKDLDDEMAMLMDAIQNDVMGKIVEVDDEEEHVEIYIE